MEDELRRRLPAAVYDLALRLGANTRAGRDVALMQTGRMRQDPASGWMKFSARQTISSHACAFEWRARTGPLGMVSIRDALSGGEGALDVRVLGFIKIAHRDPSPALTRGELMRYLAEVAWAPDAILFNTALRWRSDGPDRLMVGAGAGDAEAEVTLTLDSDGRIASVFAADRPRGVKDTFTPTPWQGRFTDYRQRQGFWLPFSGEVSWAIGASTFVYWEGRIEEWEARKIPGG
ncbi:MAG: hypothetical protein EON61_08990 [Alphaproteobacteria bacterium]|jgi:hypothetical protein|nr:MAG: hypothetical protein EON61_08990 [Alphaproteobacteria bacterium]